MNILEIAFYGAAAALLATPMAVALGLMASDAARVVRQAFRKEGAK